VDWSFPRHPDERRQAPQADRHNYFDRLFFHGHIFLFIGWLAFSFFKSLWHYQGPFMRS
jgi:hypothetical protein